MWKYIFRKNRKEAYNNVMNMFNNVRRMIRTSCNLNELDEVYELIDDLSNKTDDVDLIIRLREEHEKAVLELCGNG